MWGFYFIFLTCLAGMLVLPVISARAERKETEKQISLYISLYISNRMNTVSASLSAEQALEDIRMAIEAGNYEV